MMWGAIYLLTGLCWAIIGDFAYDRAPVRDQHTIPRSAWAAGNVLLWPVSMAAAVSIAIENAARDRDD